VLRSPIRINLLGNPPPADSSWSRAKDGFRWVALLFWRWNVVGVGSALLYGFGVGAMYGKQYHIAFCLYLVAVVWLAVKMLTWEEARRHRAKWVISISITVLAGLMLVLSTEWIGHTAAVDSSYAKGPPSSSKETTMISGLGNTTTTTKPPATALRTPKPKAKPQHRETVAGTTAKLKRPAPTPALPRRMAATDRPYVLALDARFIDDDKKLQIRYQNNGGTPAIGVSLSARYTATEGKFDLNAITPQQLSQPEGSGNVAKSEVISNDVDTRKVQFPEQFNMAKNGEGAWHIYVFGYLTYSDLEGFAYQPRFCFMWSPSEGFFVQCPPNSFVEGQDLQGKKF